MEIVNVWNLEPDEYIMYNSGEVHIVARSIDAMNISFTCPFCYDHYKKNGAPTVRAGRQIHQHGSGGSFGNRIER